MKHLLPYLIITLLLVLFIAMDSPHFSSHKEIRVVEFTGDSGYIFLPEAISILKKVHLDTLDFSYTYSNETDTIGKYYKNLTGNFYVCIEVPYHTAHKIVEVTPEGKIITSKDFYSGSSFCCWNNSYDGFQKHGKYYTIKSCSTGSGFCNGEIDVFKDLNSKAGNSILDSQWLTVPGDKYSYELSSKIKIRNDTVFMKYTLEKGVLKKRWKTYQTKNFDVFYIVKNSKWVASDTILPINNKL